MTASPYILDARRQALLDGSFTGYSAWAGLRLDSLSDGAATISFSPRAEMLSPWGTLNGGVLNGLVEMPSFVALLTMLEPGELPVTNDIFLQHIRPLPAGEYVMEGRVVRRGRTMGWTEVDVRCEGKPVTLARITKTILAGT